MAALGLQRVPRRFRYVVRRADLHLDHRPRDRDRPRDARPVRDELRVRQRRDRAPARSWASRRSSPRTCCSTSAIVLLLVRARLTGMDRTLVEASFDLYATPWRTFRQMTFPQLRAGDHRGVPAVVHVQLRRLRDHVVRVRARGRRPCPLFVFGQVKRGVTPETNAVATMMLFLTLAMLRGGPGRPQPGVAPQRLDGDRRHGGDDRPAALSRGVRTRRHGIAIA